MRTNKILILLATIAAALLSEAQAQYGSVDLFYGYITNAAAKAGYDTSSLPSAPSETYKESVDAYFWGFPLQTTYRSEISFLNGNGVPINSLYAPGVIDSGTTVEAPDTSVLYTSGFADLSASNAFVLGVPNTTATETYNIMEIANAYSGTTYSVGTRNFTNSSYNNSGGNYLLVGPEFNTSEARPSGVTGYIQSPTAQAWLIGRMTVDQFATATTSNGPTPYSLIAGGSSSPLSLSNSVPLSQSYSLTSLSDYLAGSNTPVITSAHPTPEQSVIASNNASTATGQTFYQYVGNSVAQNGVPASSSNNQLAMYQNFAGIGLTTNGYTAPTNPLIISEMNLAASNAAGMLGTMGGNTAALGSGPTSTGWTVNTTIGQYSANYSGWVTAAVTDYIGTLANLAVDGTYPQTTLDSKTNALSGTNSYTITFPAGQLPPVQGFWSITVYNTNGYVVPNSGSTYYGSNVYSLGSMQMTNVLGTNLNTTPITLYLQSQAPTNSALLPYWLPVPTEDFELILRMYYPDSNNPSILDGTYMIPAVVEAVPEPTSYALFGIGTLGLVAMLRRRVFRPSTCDGAGLCNSHLLPSTSSPLSS